MPPHLFQQHLEQPVRPANGLSDRDQPSKVAPGRGPIERLIAEPRHQIRELLAARLISSLVLVEGDNVDVELVRHEGQKFSRRRLSGFQCAAGMPKVAKQDCEPQAAMVAALGGDQIEIIAAQRAVSNDLALFSPRREQARPLLVREQLSPRHRILPPGPAG